MLSSDRGSEAGDGRRCEQSADIARQALLLHTFDERHGEQGVAAEFKEIIVAADLFDA